MAESFRQSVDVDRHLRLDLFHPLVDLELNRRASFRIGDTSEEDLHVADRLVTRTASASGVLRRVLHAAVQPKVLANPVVHQTRDVLHQVGIGLTARALRRLAGLEGEEHSAVDGSFLLFAPRLGLGHRAVELAIVAEHREHSLENRIALSHGIALFRYYVVVLLHHFG